MTQINVTLYTDGACDIHAENQPGGWAAILVARDEAGNIKREKSFSGGAENTTNNAMELTAVIEGLKALTRPTTVTIVSDSTYVINTAEKGWKRKANQALWREFDEVSEPHQLEWEYVRGHSGHEYNERCDKLAVAEKDKLRLEIDESAREATPDTAIRIALCGTFHPDGKIGTWGAVIYHDDELNETGGSLRAKSSNHVMLLAVLAVLEQVPTDGDITLTTNNDYLIDGITKRVSKWMTKGWKTQSGDPVKYQGLWQKLYAIAQSRTIYWRRVSRDDGNLNFEQAHQRAKEEYKRAKRKQT